MKYILFVLFFISNVYGDVNKFEKILFKDVKSLTFHKDVYSTGKRTKPQLQLQRIGGDAPEGMELEFAQCTQINYGPLGPEWKCRDSHKKDLDVSHFIVSCEGFDNENDEYILDGSCILKYQLGKRTYYTKSDNSGSYLSIFFIVMFIGLLITIFLKGGSSSNNSSNNEVINDDDTDFVDRENERFGGRPNTDPFRRRRLINNYSIDNDNNDMEWSCVGQSSNR
uniref:Store-operated calcium entry-associated regulatory factor n=1 Tax=Strongyloides venezuelensis TaxID=75913 RepID=A0A0K0FJQ0_STRVS